MGHLGVGHGRVGWGGPCSSGWVMVVWGGVCHAGVGGSCRGGMGWCGS